MPYFAQKCPKFRFKPLLGTFIYPRAKETLKTALKSFFFFFSFFSFLKFDFFGKSTFTLRNFAHIAPRRLIPLCNIQNSKQVHLNNERFANVKRQIYGYPNTNTQQARKIEEKKNYLCHNTILNTLIYVYLFILFIII